MVMLPEIIVILTAFAVLLLDLFLDERRRAVLAPVAMIGLGVAFVAGLAAPHSGEMFGGRFAIDAVGWWFRLFFILAAFLTVAISLDLLDGRTGVRMRGMGFRGEYYSVLLFTICGMLYMTAARDMITLYVSLELSTLPLFVLAAWRRDHAPSGEAGLKYVIYGALASSLLLYGLALVYGITGETHMDALAAAVSKASPGALWFASGLIVCGLGFKLTLVPFHMWAADVYEGAPTPVTAYLSVASKGAGLVFAFQIYYRMLGPWLQDWDLAIAFCAAATMTFGNLVAIVQHNIKRFMAFSAISQAGYLILGFIGANAEGVPAMMFYMLVYIVTNLLAFACIVWFGNETGRERIEDYRGLSRTNPIIALALMLALFSLAGIPPLSGFVGKFFLFNVTAQAGMHWLVAVAAVNSTVSLYYYLRVIRQMYIEPPAEGAATLPVTRTLAVTIGVLSAATVLLGVIPFIYETIHLQTIAWLASLR